MPHAAWVRRGSTRRPSPSRRHPLVESAPHDGTLAAEPRQAGEVIVAADTARGEDAQAGRAELGDEVEIRSSHGSVAADRGAEHASHPDLTTAVQCSRHGDGRLVKPAGDGDATVADVDGDDETIAERRHKGLEGGAVAEGGGADDNAGRARLQEIQGGAHAAHPTRHLDGNRSRRRDDGADDVLADSARSGTIEIHDMKQRRPAGDQGGDVLGHRAAGHDPLVVTTLQPDGVVTEKVHRGYRLHGDVVTCYHAPMPAASSSPPSHPWLTDQLDDLFATIVSLRDREQTRRFFRDLCTLGELEAMAQRWEVARLVHAGVAYLEISRRTGASTATVTRVAHWLHHGEGGYLAALSRPAPRAATTA